MTWLSFPPQLACGWVQWLSCWDQHAVLEGHSNSCHVCLCFGTAWVAGTASAVFARSKAGELEGDCKLSHSFQEDGEQVGWWQGLKEAFACGVHRSSVLLPCCKCCGLQVSCQENLPPSWRKTALRPFGVVKLSLRTGFLWALQGQAVTVWAFKIPAVLN